MTTHVSELTGAALSRAVADAAGYKAWYHQTMSDVSRGWKIVDKHGSAGGLPYGWDTEESAWDFFVNLHDYATDANAALTLEVEGYALRIEQIVGGWIAYYHKAPDGYVDPMPFVSSVGTTLAEAVSRAFVTLA